jgi:argininosuccinate lyase
MKGLPLTYNQDLQEDKEGLFDAVDTITQALSIYAEMVRTLTVNRAAMARAAQGGFMTATDLADYLARCGLPFRQAHEVVGRIVRYCVESGKELSELTLAEMQEFSPLFDEGALRVVTPEAAVAARDVYGGTAPAQVQARLVEARQMLSR